MSEIITLDNMTFTNTKIAVNYWKRSSDQMSRLEQMDSGRIVRKEIIELLRSTSIQSGNIFIAAQEPNINSDIHVHWRLIKTKTLYEK